MVKDPPCSAEDTGLIPGWGAEGPGVLERLSLHPQLPSMRATAGELVLQERIPHGAVKIHCAAAKMPGSQIHKLKKKVRQLKLLHSP